MTGTSCGRCRAAVLNRYLCQRCEGVLADTARDVPVLLAELDVTLARLGTRPGGDGGGDHAPVIDATVSEAARYLRNVCLRWALRRHGYGLPIGDAPWMWLWENADVIACTWDDAAQCVADLERATAAGWRKVDHPPNRWYAGPCDAELGPERYDEHGVLVADGLVRCGRVLWADPEAATVRCPACRTRWDVADRRAWLLRAAEDHVDTVTRVASALTLVLRRRIPRATIAAWLHRGKLTAHGANPTTVRVGDVVTLIARGEHTEAPDDPQQESA